MRLNTGEIINNRYRIVQMINQGGFGAVYRAWDLNLNAPCAVKMNHEYTPVSVKQFAREASLLANLRHSNLPKVFDHFTIPDVGQFLVMELIGGQDMQDLIDNAGGPLPESQVLDWIDQVLDALIYLHSQNPPVLHRDIKPANVRITPEGQAVLVDFGIAKIFDPGGSATLGRRSTTPGFAPVEQYGHSPTDERSDIYSLGATLYAALTGQFPPESISRTSGDSLPPPSKFNPAITPAVQSVILKAMSVLPELRYQTAREMRTALSAARLAAEEPPTLILPAGQSLPSAKVQPSQESTPPSTKLYPPAAEAAPPQLPQSPEPMVVPKVPVVTPARKRKGLWIFGGFLAIILLALCGLVLWTSMSTMEKQSNARASETYLAATQVSLRETDAAITVLKGVQATLEAQRMTQAAVLPSPLVPTIETVTPTDQAIVTDIAVGITSTPLSDLSIIELSGWRKYFFIEIPSGCREKGVLCLQLRDDYKAAGGGADAYLTLETPVYIDPGWPNPYLVFKTDMDIKRDARIDIGFDNKWQTVRSYSTVKYTWYTEAIRLDLYYGKEILVRFTAFVGFARQSQWSIEAVRIIPDYQP